MMIALAYPRPSSTLILTCECFISSSSSSQVDGRQLLAQATIFHEQRLLVPTLAKWRQFSVASKQLTQAKNFSRQHLLRKGLTALLTWHHRRQRLKALLTVAQEKRQRKHKQQLMLHWQGAAMLERQARPYRAKLQTRHEKTLLRRGFTAFVKMREFLLRRLELARIIYVKKKRIRLFKR